MRVLIRIALIVAAIWLLWRALTRTHRQPTRQLPDETMRRCAYCGTFVPDNEAIQQRDRYFCSTQHLERFRG